MTPNSDAEKPPWRIGSHYGIHVYEGDAPIATFHTALDAKRAVDAVNGSLATDAALAETVLALFIRDNHRWSTRPCSTCRQISALLGHSWGCSAYKEGEPGGN